jgi:Mg-chelatase subunit ChlD
MPTTNTTNVCLVLDKSGSMQSVYEDALGAVNGYITRAKQDRNLYEARFSLITFNSQGVDTIRANEVMETVKPLAHGEYSCAGMTPLYDAVGRGIGVLDEATAGKDAAKAILVVMTDGMENDSKEFNHAKITGLIKARQDAGWLVIFLGEGLDVAKQGEAMGAAEASVAAYSGGKGLRAAGDVVARVTARYASISGDVRQARDKAAFTPKERDELAGKK